MGKVRCDHARTSVFEGEPVVRCAHGLAQFPLYPHASLGRLVTECRSCPGMVVTCVGCGEDITDRARENGKVYYCKECRPYS